MEIEICLFVFQPVDGGGRCDSVGPVGCIYTDLIPSHLRNQLKIEVSDSEDFPDVTKCLLGCRAIFPDAFFAGVRVSEALDNGRNELECSCLQPHAYNSSTLGPSANCNQVLTYTLSHSFHFVSYSSFTPVTFLTSKT